MPEPENNRFDWETAFLVAVILIIIGFSAVNAAAVLMDAAS